MLALSSDVWFPAVTLAGGILLTSFLSWIREILVTRRERAKERDAFQRESLGALQEALSELMLGYGKAYGLRLAAQSKKDSDKEGYRLPQDLWDRILDAERRVEMLASRVADD